MSSLHEVRRHVHGPAAIDRLSAAEYEKQVARLYEAGDEAALDAAENLGEELDLARLAEDLPEPADLLESEDDAPIIRLINGVLTPGVREGASDIPLEPFAERVSIRLRGAGAR